MRVDSSKTAMHIIALRKHGFTLRELAAAAGLSLGVVAKASRSDQVLDEATEAVIVELVEKPGLLRLR